ncbi:MAG TPA: sulfur carrier protein ThiS [Candidatus Deferrimicrobium sp.]|nr:sulfur carrier protein ThiS [Candidatus Deferrimicrobium sp.]
MKIVVNGQQQPIREGLTIKQLLEEQKAAVAIAIVEHNGQILTKECWDDTILQENDTLEILILIGGG